VHSTVLPAHTLRFNVSVNVDQLIQGLGLVLHSSNGLCLSVRLGVMKVSVS